MRRNLLMACGFVVFGAAAFLLFSRYENVERLETRVTANIRTDRLDRIWFSPAGELVGMGRNESRLAVRVWSAGGGALVRERTVTLPAAGKPVFAVSADGALAAWADAAGVRVANLLAPEGTSPGDPRPGRRVPISSLAFLGSGQLAVLYQDDELELRDLGVNRVAAATQLEIDGPGLLIANGSYLAVYSSESGEAFVFDTSGGKFSRMEYMRYSPGILSLTLSPLARFAVTNGEKIEMPGQFISAPGKVRSLAFLDRNRLLVGGDFQGIYLLGANQGPQLVVDAPPGTSLLAAAGSSLVFGDGSSLALASSHVVRKRVYLGLTLPSKWLLITLLALCSPLMIYFFYGAFTLYFRKAKALPLEPLVPQQPPEGPLPNGLVEACQNGDCVLWAGSGLGAQAGLPGWSAFLRELAEWDSRSDLARDPDAADRIAAAFENREQALHDYLRGRLRVTSELSAAHLLLKEVGFQAVVTTALDNLVDRAFPYSGGRVYTAGKCEELAGLAAHRDFFLLKPFGDLDEPDTIRIGPAQCALAIASSPAALELMQDLFDTRVFLFIGAALEGLERDLANLNLPAPTERKHYALVCTADEGWEAGAGRLRQRYAIEAITYSPSTAQHPEVVDFLTTLIELIRKRNYTPEQYEAR